MHLIVYMSEYLGDTNSMFSDIGDIITVSKAENAKRGITGILLYHKGIFVQFLEGEEVDLRSLMKNIEKDERHKNVQYLLDRKITSRGFEQWNMDFFNLSDRENLNRDEMIKISKLYQKEPLNSSEELKKMYKDLIKVGVFVDR